jgi:hypothetical protein
MNIGQDDVGTAISKNEAEAELPEVSVTEIM